MSIATPKSPMVQGHSADVRITLEADGKTYSPTHTASDYLRFLHPQAISPSQARLIISIDGTPYESIIEILPHESPNTRIPVRIIERMKFDAA